MINALKNIWKISKDRHQSLITALIFSFIKATFGITQLFAIMITIDIFTKNADVTSGLIQVCILTLICVIGNFLVTYVEEISIMKTGFLMAGDERIRIGNRLRKIPLGFFNTSSMGQLTTTLTTTISNIETAGTMVMVGIVSGLFDTVVLFIFTMFYDWRIGIVAGVGMIAYLLIVNWQMKVSDKNAPKLQAAQNKLSENTLTFLKGIKVIKSFSCVDGDKNLKSAIDGSCKNNIKLTNVSMPSQYFARISIAIFESLILFITLYLYFVKGDISLVKAIILIIFSFMVYASLNQAGSMLAMIGLMNSSFHDIEKVANASELKVYEPIEKMKNNEIVFDNVCFDYGDRQVLKNLSFTLKQDTLTALIGPSGSGKSTLCQLITRFREVKNGKITIGGVDVKNIDYFELMKKISMVFQNVYLFEDTIFNNIKFGKDDATMDEVVDAAKKAQCHDFIMKLPDGYNTILKEGGNTLSGGEKQRISIARAIIKDSPIIILDEATSALDPENEQEILKAIDKLTENKTVLMIAHRIKTVKNADKIIALSDGEIVQSGTHDELVNVDGLYKNFLNARENASGWKIEN